MVNSGDGGNSGKSGEIQEKVDARFELGTPISLPENEGTFLPFAHLDSRGPLIHPRNSSLTTEIGT